jgi:thiamine biosynthesis lipoprotein
MHNLASVTVIADDAAFADAMATALLALGPDKGMQLALRENIATLFLLHAESGFDESMTPAFAALGTTQ